jgi:hypothetical protein
MVSSTVTVIAWAPSASYAPHRRELMHVEERTEIAQARCCYYSQGRRHGGEPPECDRRTGVKGVDAIQEKYNPA